MQTWGAAGKPRQEQVRPVGESNEKQAHLLILDFLLDVLNSVAGLDIEGDGFASECFDENLHGGGENLGSGLNHFTRRRT